MKGVYKDGKILLEMSKTEADSWLTLIEKYIQEHEDDLEFQKAMAEEDEDV